MKHLIRISLPAAAALTLATFTFSSWSIQAGDADFAKKA